MARRPKLILNSIAQWALEESAAIADEESPFRGHLMSGDPRLLLITGENASGKSLLFRMICQIARTQHKILPITLSIRERTGSGAGDMSRIARAFMYGDEVEQSTGANSARIIATGFNNVRRDKPTILGLDEPELGLSDGYAEALGEYIGKKTTDLAETCSGVLLVTHNRRLVQGLVRGLANTPSFVSMTEQPLTLEDWLKTEERKSVDQLLALSSVALERFRATNRLLKDRS